MSKRNTTRFIAQPRLSALMLATLVLTGCANITPQPLADKEVRDAVAQDQKAVRQGVEPIAGLLTLNEAMARALKYNLERRAKMMEESIALGQLDVTKFDMLPRLMAQAGYASRDTARFTWSSGYNSTTPSSTNPLNTSTSAEPNHTMSELGLTWSLLDYGMGKSASEQAANRVLVAAEKRRKAMHVLMQDVRTAYWRAASAQLLRDDVARTVKLAEEALADSRKAAGEMLRTPLEPLRYQRQLLENLRLLESINQELSTAMVDLANLVNAPVGQPIVIADAQVRQTADNLAEVPVQRLEEVALLNNADLREQHYNTRVAQEEVRKTMVRLFPNITFSYGMKYDSDAYLLHNQWNETGLQLSWNLMNLFTGATQKKLAEAGVKLADQRRLASQMAVVTQVHLSRLQLMNARSQLSRAEAIYNTDRQIADLMKNRQVAAAQSKLDSVSNETAAILSLLRRYQAMAQVQVAENRLMATLGMEPKIGSTQETSLQDLTRQLAAAPLPWTQLKDTAPMVQPVTVSTKW